MHCADHVESVRTLRTHHNAADLLNFSTIYRVQERGAAKEQEFSKKVEKHRAAKEGFHSAFQGLAVAEPKVNFCGCSDDNPKGHD